MSWSKLYRKEIPMNDYKSFESHAVEHIIDFLIDMDGLTIVQALGILEFCKMSIQIGSAVHAIEEDKNE